MTARCPHEPDVAAWVLGALDEAEAERFAHHLAACPSCPPQVAELQAVADTLPLAAMPVSPPPALKDRIMRTVRAEAELLAAAGPEADRPPAPAPRRRRWSLVLRPPLAAALACALLALGVAAGVLATRDGDLRRVPAEVALTERPQARAAVLVADDGDAELEVAGWPAAPDGRVWQVWVLRDGEQAPRPTDALFDVQGGRATVEVPGGTRGVAAVLVTHEPDGGSRAPTSDVAVVARLS
jgi:anti-sigma factor RsiW